MEKKYDEIVKKFNQLIDKIIVIGKLCDNRTERYSDFLDSNAKSHFKYFKPNKPKDFHGDYRGLHRQLCLENVNHIYIRLDFEDFKIWRKYKEEVEKFNKEIGEKLKSMNSESYIYKEKLPPTVSHVFEIKKEIGELTADITEEKLEKLAQEIWCELFYLDLQVKDFITKNEKLYTHIVYEE